MPPKPCILTNYTSPHPPAETLGHFIEVYRKVLHLQPLPLFDMDTLQSDLAKAPEFLLWSFLALILSFSGHEFYHGRESDARNFYSQSAEQAVVKMAVEGIPRVEVLQSLCLLALRHIKGTYPKINVKDLFSPPK